MRIAIFDYKIVPTNPIGSCHLAMLRALAGEHEFTVFAVEFDNPHPERIRWVRIPAPTRPLALLFVAYHLLAPLGYAAERLRTRRRYDLVQTVESNLSFGDLIYSHFCHRRFLKAHWRATGAGGLRGRLRWLDHTLHAWMEALVYPRARRVVAPSRGLARELAGEYPAIEPRLSVLPNPIDLKRFAPAADFDRQAFRRGLGLLPGDTVLLFVALGQFERKGLPLLLAALAAMGRPGLRLLVVGGEPDLIASYRQQCARLDLAQSVRFVGMQAEVRPYFWSADVFVFPSLYETFSLVSYQAAAAGLALLVPRLNGVEDILRDGENGLLIERSVDGVRRGLERWLALPEPARRAMGDHAVASAAAYGPEQFVAGWRSIYAESSRASGGVASKQAPPPSQSAETYKQGQPAR